MPETRDAQSLLKAAERSAGERDYPAAAALLKEAADVQETTLGPHHPDLSNTFNNLGVVYETLGQLTDAERSFRRAYAIARASFADGHTALTTIRENLRDFCGSHQISFDDPAVTPAPAAPEREQPAAPADSPRPEAEAIEPPRPVVPAAEPPRTVPSKAPSVATTPGSQNHLREMVRSRPPAASGPPLRSPVPPVAARQPTRAVALAGAGLALLLAVIALAWFGRGGRSEAPERTEATAEPAPPAVAASTAAPVVPVEAPPASAPAAPEPAVAEPRATTGGAAASTAGSARAASLPPSVDVLEARLCRPLSDWQCTDADRTLESGAGRVSFLTRLRAPRSTVVEHRWYRDDRLQQAVQLRIQPNQTGYRTYSRTTIGGASSGDWRIELRDSDDTLLHEERFTVR